MSVINEKINTLSGPSDLRITDVRFVSLHRLPMPCILMKIYTNQGIVGYGEVRDGASKSYALMLKRLLIGENPCNVDKLFRRIKQFGGPARQAGGVSGVEVALWDLAGKAYGQPVYRLLGGKFRDDIRMYCDTDVAGHHVGTEMGQALKDRMALGYTFLKMDLGIMQLFGVPGTLSAPLGYFDEGKKWREAYDKAKADGDNLAMRYAMNRMYDLQNVPHPLTGIHLTEKGLDQLEEYVRQVRDVIGYEVPLAIDHFGHVCVEDCIRLCRRIEKFNLAWAEDLIPWQNTQQYVHLRNSTTTPICTGEDIYLKEGFEPLLKAGGVAVIHPDVLSTGGILELKKISDLAADNNVAMAIHMAESPIGCLAAVHAAAASENFLALEFHSVDVPRWNDLYDDGLPKPLVQNGFIKVPDRPGLGIEDLNDEVIAEFVDPRWPGMWEETGEYWDNDHSHDRTWS